MAVSQAIVFLSTILAIAIAIPPAVDYDPQFPLRQEAIRVPVELGVMSRCPDALVCESVFDQVLKEVGRQKMDLSLIYVAKLNSTDTEFGVTCMHGPMECAGNVQQLCVSKYASPNAWWEFVQCQNSHGRYQVGIPELTLQCARNMGSGKGEEGIELLRESLLLGQTLGIKKSCTVLINRKKVCVHDETWQDCEGGHEVEDFAKRINKEYENINVSS
ncbi:hypothetical protein MVEN_01246300 [Mycena venus]|uniref:Uncharacterized protein n=1 Tax=Mycena venus TaxID=2733690 RepID=A0A8H7CWE1_9AGAR|nr:hypothetical protein MVEN_01246300 [Mycena venus]